MQSIPYDPEQSQVYLERAEAALSRDDRATALLALEDATRYDPFNDELPLLAAMLHLEMDDPCRAAELALRTIRLRPFHPAAMNFLAVACMDAGEPQLACRILKRAARMAPSLAKIRKNLGDAERQARAARKAAANTRKHPREMLRGPIEELLESGEPTLCCSVLVDTRNVERLPACLESLRQLADRIVVVDRRAERGALRLPEHPAIEVHQDARPDAVDCRNETLRRAGTDWILWLDADELVTEESAGAILKSMRESRDLCCELEVREAEGPVRRREIRLVRNAPGVRFRSPLSRRLLPSLLPLEEKWGLGVGTCDAVLLARTVVGPERRRDRILMEIDRLADGDPVEAFAVLELARVDLESGQAESALEHVRRARQIVDSVARRRRPIELEEPTVVEGRCLMQLQRHRELERLVSDYHRAFPETAGTLFLEGIAAKGLEEPGRAAELLGRAMELRDRVSFVPIPPEASGPGMPNLLGAALLDLGELEQARRAFETALESDADNAEARIGQIAILHAQGELRKVLEELDRLVERHGDNPNVWLAGGIVLERVPALAAPTLGWLEEARSRFPRNAEIQRRLAEAQLRCGAAEMALRNLGMVPPGPSDLTGARIAAALACGGELPQRDDESCEGTSTEVVAWFGRWMEFGAFESLDRALLDIERADRAFPGLGDRTASWLEGIDQREAAAGVRARLEAGVPVR